MKKLAAFFLALMILVSSAGAVTLYVDTTEVETDSPPVIVSGRTMVPLRAIFEAIGATVTWDQDTRTATGVRGDTSVVIQIDSTVAYVNHEARTLDVPAQIINSRTMVPARFVSEAMDCDVTWHQDSQTVAVANKLKNQKIYVPYTGENYHFDATCNDGNYYEITLADMIARTLPPCEKCVHLSSFDTDQTTTIPDTSSTSTAPTTTTTPTTPAAPTTPTAPTSPTTPTQQPNQSQVVYVTKTGKRYHYNPNCNGGTYYKSTLQEALTRGLTPCQKCVH